MILVFAVVFTVGFAALGFAAIRITGETVEANLERRVDFTLDLISKNPAFFLFEASLREGHLRQLTALSGFEIVVPAADGQGVAGASLARERALRFLASAPDADRFKVSLDGELFRGARAGIEGRTVYLLSPAASVEAAKAEARREVSIVSGLGLVAAVLIGALLAGTISRPIRRLAEGAKRVREGESEIELPAGGGREVRDLSRALAEMLEGLARYREELVASEKLATLGGFSASVAHELRNPLSSMRMTVEMLLPDADEASREELLFLLAEMARLDHHVEELLFHSGTPRYDMSETDLAGVAHDTVRVLGPLARHLGVTLEVRENAHAKVTADGGKLRQAVTNLLLNALQASPEGGAVTVTVAADDAVASLAVADQGAGVATEISESLFEPFVSGRPGGTGLGLAVTWAIMAAHHGEVSWERRGDRTTFTLVFPGGG
jgi:signal transduction histidine kinase